LRYAVELQARAAAGGDESVLAREIPRLDHWFTPDAARALAGAVNYLDEVPTQWQDRISLAISASVVRLGRQESDTRYAAIDNPVTQAGAAVELGQSVVRMCDWLAKRRTPGTPGSVNVLCQDSTDLSNLPEEYYAAAVFSPPYPNAYEYWLYHKYRMYWLGFDPISVRERELGARPHYSKTNGLTEEDFGAQMADVFRGLARALQPRGRVVVVIGDSVIGGRHVDNGNLMAEVATSTGYALEAWARRDIRRTRSSFNRAHGQGRREEHVMLFQRS
jgi:site-specific DNA-methyltransferase (cytosine-N4-specific)